MEMNGRRMYICNHRARDDILYFFAQEKKEDCNCKKEEKKQLVFQQSVQQSGHKRVKIPFI